jgi:cobaltochelatase CobN
LTDAVSAAQFDLMFDATLGDDTVRAFLVSANHQAACHMAGVFEEATKRGFWLSRRNSSARILASVLREAA